MLKGLLGADSSAMGTGSFPSSTVDGRHKKVKNCNDPSTTKRKQVLFVTLSVEIWIKLLLKYYFIGQVVSRNVVKLQ